MQHDHAIHTNQMQPLLLRQVQKWRFLTPNCCSGSSKSGCSHCPRCRTNHACFAGGCTLLSELHQHPCCAQGPGRAPGGGPPGMPGRGRGMPWGGMPGRICTQQQVVKQETQQQVVKQATHHSKW